MSQLQTLVMLHDGWSYIKFDHYNMRQNPATLIVNGESGRAVACPGAMYWAMVEGEVKTLAVPQPPTIQRIGFRLQDVYRDTTTFPRELPANAFEFDDDRDELVPVEPGAVYSASFYDAVHESIEREPLRIELIVIDRNCAPMNRPADVNIEFPASLREYPETWHKHPVSISGKALFQRATALLRAEVQARPNDFSMTDYENIGTFTLFRIMHHKPTEYSYHVGKRTKRATKTQSNVEVMKISAPDSSYRDGAIVPKPLAGENWSALEPQINLFLDMIRAYIQPGRVCLCPHCDGEGFLIGDAQ